MTKETGLIFSTDMALANVEKRKFMTRRTRGLERINVDPDAVAFIGMDGDRAIFKKLRNFRQTVELPPLRSCPEIKTEGEYPNNEILIYIKCPFGQVGDGIWQRETWFAEKQYDHLKPSDIPIISLIGYTARDIKPDWAGKTRSPLFMCRWMSHFAPPITELRAERLQDISEADAKREGAYEIHTINNPQLLYPDIKGYRRGFLFLWDTYNKKRGYGWDLNKWVWVIGWHSPKGDTQDNECAREA